MKLTKSQLKQIIKEEIAKVLHEERKEWKPPGAQIADATISCEDNLKMLNKLRGSFAYSPAEIEDLERSYRSKCGNKEID